MPMCGSADQMGLGISLRFVDARLVAVLMLMGVRSALRQNEVLASGERDRWVGDYFFMDKVLKVGGFQISEISGSNFSEGAKE